MSMRNIGFYSMARPRLPEYHLHNMLTALGKAKLLSPRLLHTCATTSSRLAWLVAIFIVKRPWPNAEPMIAKNWRYAENYAANILELKGQDARDWGWNYRLGIRGGNQRPADS